jgi:predicted nucleic acid-binding protein
MEPIAPKPKCNSNDDWNSSSDVPVRPVTLAIARLAGRIEGQQEAIGVQFAFEDLLIGATALHLGYEVATSNLRDFRRIPGLSVIQL